MVDHLLHPVECLVTDKRVRHFVIRPNRNFVINRHDSARMPQLQMGSICRLLHMWVLFTYVLSVVNGLSPRVYM